MGSAGARLSLSVIVTKLACQLGEGAAVRWSGVGRTGFSCVWFQWRCPGGRRPHGGGYVMGRLESCPSKCGLQSDARDQTRKPKVQRRPQLVKKHSMCHQTASFRSIETQKPRRSSPLHCSAKMG